MNWDDLKVCLAVARDGSIRAAASRLGVNHATVSRRINALEEQLGVRLFDRLPSGYVCTPYGEDMFREAQHLEETVHSLERRLIGQDANLTGDIRVTIPSTLARLFMPDFAAFADVFPELSIEIIPSFAVLNLSKREADVAVRITENPPEHLVGRKLVKYAMATYISKDCYRRYMNDASGPRSWLGWDEPVTFPKWVKESELPDIPLHHRINDELLQREATKAGMGIASIPCFLGDVEPDLMRLPPGKTRPGYSVWILTHPDLRETVRISTFMRSMVDAVEKHRDLLEGYQGQVPA